MIVQLSILGRYWYTPKVSKNGHISSSYGPVVVSFQFGIECRYPIFSHGIPKLAWYLSDSQKRFGVEARNAMWTLSLVSFKIIFRYPISKSIEICLNASKAGFGDGDCNCSHSEFIIWKVLRLFCPGQVKRRTGVGKPLVWRCLVRLWFGLLLFVDVCVCFVFVFFVCMLVFLIVWLVGWLVDYSACGCCCSFVCFFDCFLFACLVVCLFVCLFVCLLACLLAWLCVCLLVWLFVCLFVCLFVWFVGCLFVSLVCWLFVCFFGWLVVSFFLSFFLYFFLFLCFCFTVSCFCACLI